MSGTTNPEVTTEPLEQQQLLLDGLRRISQHSPVMMMPRLVMTQHLHQMLSGARKRRDDDHRYQMGLLGVKVQNQEAPGISLQGDTINHNYMSQKVGAIAGPLTKAALVAGLVVLGGAGAYLWDALQSARNPSAPSAPPAVSQPLRLPPVVAPTAPQDWRLGVEVQTQP